MLATACGEDMELAKGQGAEDANLTSCLNTANARAPQRHICPHRRRTVPFQRHANLVLGLLPCPCPTYQQSAFCQRCPKFAGDLRPGTNGKTFGDHSRLGKPTSAPFLISRGFSGLENLRFLDLLLVPEVAWRYAFGRGRRAKRQTVPDTRRLKEPTVQSCIQRC